MSRNRRDRRKSRGQVMFITARVCKGLPFVARLSVEKVLLGILARAQGLYPVQVCAFVFMGNHYHMIITGHSCHFSPFMNYIQGEISKSMKRFIPGFYESKFWEKRFSEQILLGVEDVIEKMAYIYLNPVKARLVHRAIEYPGLSSYRYLNKGKTSLLCKWIPSRKLVQLPDYYNKKQDLKIIKTLLSDMQIREELSISPYAWFSSFKEQLSEEDVFQKISNLVEESEAKLLTHVVGVEKLYAQRIRKEFKSKTKGRTPYLICYDKQLRRSEIISYQQFCLACRLAWQSLKKGIACLWPRGAYRPWMRWGPLLSS